MGDKERGGRGQKSQKIGDIILSFMDSPYNIFTKKDYLQFVLFIFRYSWKMDGGHSEYRVNKSQWHYFRNYLCGHITLYEGKNNKYIFDRIFDI